MTKYTPICVEASYPPPPTLPFPAVPPSILSQILSSTQIALTKVFKYDDPNLWAPEPGPLKVVAINTGAGRLALNAEDTGVVIAEIQADLSGHGVSVQSHESLDIYQSTKSIQIAGSGFVDNMKASKRSQSLFLVGFVCRRKRRGGILAYLHRGAWTSDKPCAGRVPLSGLARLVSPSLCIVGVVPRTWSYLAIAEAPAGTIVLQSRFVRRFVGVGGRCVSATRGMRPKCL